MSRHAENERLPERVGPEAAAREPADEPRRQRDPAAAAVAAKRALSDQPSEFDRIETMVRRYPWFTVGAVALLGVIVGVSSKMRGILTVLLAGLVKRALGRYLTPDRPKQARRV